MGRGGVGAAGGRGLVRFVLGGAWWAAWRGRREGRRKGKEEGKKKRDRNSHISPRLAAVPLRTALLARAHAVELLGLLVLDDEIDELAAVRGGRIRVVAIAAVAREEGDEARLLLGFVRRLARRAAAAVVVIGFCGVVVFGPCYVVGLVGRGRGGRGAVFALVGAVLNGLDAALAAGAVGFCRLEEVAVCRGGKHVWVFVENVVACCVVCGDDGVL